MQHISIIKLNTHLVFDCFISQWTVIAMLPLV